MPDWSLDNNIAQCLFQTLGIPQVDLMATASSKKVPFYYSALLDNEALGVDAFTKKWDDYSLSYIFPPAPIVELVLNRIYQCSKDSRFILVMRWATSATWFPKALKYDSLVET